MKKLVLIGALVIAAAAVGYFYISQKSSTKTFPILASGSYLGFLELGQKGEPQERIKLYVERDSQSGQTIFAVNSPGWQTQIFRDKDNVINQSNPAIEVVLNGPDGKSFILEGIAVSRSHYNGKTFDKEKGESGTWNINALSEYSPVKTDQPSSQQVESLRSYLLLKSQLNDVDEKIGLGEITVAQQKSEIAKLTHYITEGESLKRNSDNRYREAREQLKVAMAELELKKEEARQLSSKFELSQRVSSTGKLVYLARESLEREGRWINSILKFQGGDINAADLDFLVARGERIIDLKNQIALEQDRLNRLVPNPYAESSPKELKPGNGGM